MKEKTLLLPELLAPAGTPEALIAALRGGADAVYLGGRLLNARMRAKNFDDSALRDAVLRCHDAGSRIYVTLNTIVFDRECDEAIRYAAFLYESGVDALIVSDLGLASSIKKYIPDFELHASTQLSSHNHLAGIELEKRGFSRMVVARELSKENIRSTVEKSPIEIEMFVHGALCVSHSGQCLCSWAMGGRMFSSPDLRTLPEWQMRTIMSCNKESKAPVHQNVPHGRPLFQSDCPVSNLKLTNHL